MAGSKIRLSDAEKELFGNREIILTKNTVMQKTASLLSNVQEALFASASPSVRQASPPPKISKGENYLGLPYLILDYPRISTGQDLFFIRSLFWWGNFFSSTLQLSGTYKQKQLAALTNAYHTFSNNAYWVGVNADPWVHHFEADNFREINSYSPQAFAVILEETPHVKIAKRWPLQKWDYAEENLIESWKLLMAVLDLK